MSTDLASGSPSDRAAWLNALVTEESPAAVAVIGERAAAMLGLERAVGEVEPLDGGAAWQRFGSLADCLESVPEGGGADVALFAPDSLDGLEQALGAACRLFPVRLLLLVEAPDLPAPERLFAFGFRRVATMRRATDDDRPTADPDGGPPASAGAASGGGRTDEGAATPDAVVYEYRLRDYKQPPDWLNARFWANPSRFELDEEPSEFEDEMDEFEDDEFEDDESEDDVGEQAGGEER